MLFDCPDGADSPDSDSSKRRKGKFEWGAGQNGQTSQQDQTVTAAEVIAAEVNKTGANGRSRTVHHEDIAAAGRVHCDRLQDIIAYWQ